MIEGIQFGNLCILLSKIIFKDNFLSSDINIKRTIPNKKAITLIKAIIAPAKTKNSPIILNLTY